MHIIIIIIIKIVHEVQKDRIGQKKGQNNLQSEQYCSWAQDNQCACIPLHLLTAHFYKNTAGSYFSLKISFNHTMSRKKCKFLNTIFLSTLIYIWSQLLSSQAAQMWINIMQCYYQC